MKEKCFQETPIYHYQMNNLGEGACLRAVEIQELFGSGVDIESDIKISKL